MALVVGRSIRIESITRCWAARSSAEVPGNDTASMTTRLPSTSRIQSVSRWPGDPNPVGRPIHNMRPDGAGHRRRARDIHPRVVAAGQGSGISSVKRFPWNPASVTSTGSVDAKSVTDRNFAARSAGVVPVSRISGSVNYPGTARRSPRRRRSSPPRQGWALRHAESDSRPSSLCPRVETNPGQIERDLEPVNCLPRTSVGGCRTAIWRFVRTRARAEVARASGSVETSAVPDRCSGQVGRGKGQRRARR